MNDDEELRWVRRREGTHRSESRATRGYERDLLRDDDTKNLLGPTESRPADIDEIVRSRGPVAPARPSPGQEFRYQVGDAIMEALAPYIERGVDVAVDAAVLGVSRLWKWATTRPPRQTFSVEVGKVDEVPTAYLEGPLAEHNEPPSEELARSPQSMTAEQYQAILLSALLADQYAARARSMLANVRIDDEVLPSELEDAVRAALDGPTVDDATLVRVVELLRESMAPDGEYVLVRPQQFDAPPAIADRTRDTA